MNKIAFTSKPQNNSFFKCKYARGNQETEKEQ